MKKQLKSLILVLIISLLSLSIIACDDDVVDYTNIKAGMGVLEEIIENDEGVELIFRLANNEVFKLNSSKDLASKFDTDMNYTFTYDKTNNNIIGFDEMKLSNLETGKDPVDTPKFKEISISDSKFDSNGLTLVDTVETVVTNNDKEDLINLYSSAEKDDSGELMLDDGQDWKLVVHTGNGDYILFDDYVQGPALNLYVFTENDTLKIVTLNSGTANLNLNEYIYDDTSKVFKVYDRYSAIDDINMIFNN